MFRDVCAGIPNPLSRIRCLPSMLKTRRVFAAFVDWVNTTAMRSTCIKSCKKIVREIFISVQRWIDYPITHHLATHTWHDLKHPAPVLLGWKEAPLPVCMLRLGVIGSSLLFFFLFVWSNAVRRRCGLWQMGTSPLRGRERFPHPKCEVEYLRARSENARTLKFLQYRMPTRT